MEFFPEFKFSVSGSDERRSSEDIREALWGKWPFRSTAGAGRTTTSSSTISQLEQGVDDSAIECDLDMEDMMFMNGFNDEQGKTGYQHRERRDECEREYNNVTGAKRDHFFSSSVSRRGSDDSLVSDSSCTTSTSSSSCASTSPSSTISNRFFNDLSSSPSARSQPIDIRRPKRVLILLESGVVVTPSSDYYYTSASSGNYTTSTTTSTEPDANENDLIDSAILEPRSPPQEERRMPPTSNDVKKGPVSTATAPNNLQTAKSGVTVDTDTAFRSAKKQRTSTILSNDSDISVLDLGPSLLKVQYQHQHRSN